MLGLVNNESYPEREAARVAVGIRRRVLEHTLKNNGGYMSQACSSAEILATLFTRVMKLGSSGSPCSPENSPACQAP